MNFDSSKWKLCGLIVGGSGINVREFAKKHIAEGCVVLYIDGGAQIWRKP